MFYLLQDAVRQAQSNMMQRWYTIRTACEQLAEGSAQKLSACSKLADTERVLIEVMQSADDLVVSPDANNMFVGMHQRHLMVLTVSMACDA